MCKFAHTTQHGAIRGKEQTQMLTLYNLDVIISVGYRVKSQRGTQFLIWANKVLKEYLIKGRQHPCGSHADDCRKLPRREGCDGESGGEPY